MSQIDRRPEGLYLGFRMRVEAGLAAAQAAGLDVYLFEGLRSAERQAALYAQGRTLRGPIVTRAPPWLSWHQYGVAADLAFGGEGRWNWSGDFAAVAVHMRAAGLEDLSFERPHWQLPLAGVLTLQQARELVATSGSVESVWQAIDRKRTMH